MKRRTLLAALAAAPLRAQTHIDYRDYSRCLPDYLKRLAREAAAARDAELARCTSAEAVRARQRHVREAYWKMIGGGPLEKTPLKLRTTGAFERKTYRVEKIVYESRPGLIIPANLYLPKTSETKLPGVLFQMGHSLNGKASSLYQYCCQALAQLGYVVLAFDPMGQGERTAYPDPKTGLTRLRSADSEHTYPGKQLLLCGDTSTRLQTWDSVRSLDVLASHPMVDPSRLASTGNSGGGTTSMFLSAVDDRLACVAAACPNTENHALADLNGPGSVDDAEQCLIDAPAYGIDRWDLLHPLAPKPLLVLVSARDWFGTYSPRYLSNGRAEFARLKRFYELMGAGEKIGWYETPLPHGLGYDVRMGIYNWFERWLKGSSKRIEKEPPVSPEPDELLYAAKGNVSTLDSLTPHQLAVQAAARIRTPERPENLAALLRLDPPSREPAKKIATVRSRGCEADSIEIPVTPEVTVPAWVFRGANAGSRPPVVLLEPAGRSSQWNEDSLYQLLAETGRTVIAPDLRGVGDLNAEFPRHAARHAASHQDEESYAWASLMLGKPLLGQRVTDLLAVVRAARSLYGATSVHIAARDKMTVPALAAAALEPSAAAVYLVRPLASWRSLVEAEQYDHSFANFLPGVLREADLPQIAEMVKPRKVAVGTEWSLAAIVTNLES